MKALVIGGGADVFAEVAETERMFGADWWDIAVAANDVACHWPRHLDALVTLHPEKLGGWIDAREANGHPRATEHIVRHGRTGRGVDRKIRHPFGNGSSGLLAVAVAMDLGATKIVCCGVPMSRTAYFQESDVHPEGKVFAGANAHWKKWRQHGGELDGIVKSCSGRTRDLLGYPTLEWLESESEAAA